jgi:hypothetical protein
MLTNPTVSCIGVGGGGGGKAGVTLTLTLIFSARTKEGNNKNGIISSNFFIILISFPIILKFVKQEKKEKKLNKFFLLNVIAVFKQELILLRR